MTNRRLLASAALTVLTAAMLGAAPARAQTTAAKADAADIGLEEVVVTAERRSTSLQKTPLAVTSLDRQDAVDRGVTDLKSLSGQAPGLVLPGLSSQRTVDVFYIRGIGEADTSQNPAVGIYVDDVYIPRAWGSIYEIPDIAQIEVLRGPQGTLFGRNTSAGLIHIKTTDPGMVPHASIEGAYGEYNEILVRGTANGPILGDKLSGSLGFVHHTRDGYIDGVVLNKDLNALSTDALRGKLRYTPNSRLEIQLGFDIVNDRSDASTYAPVNQPNGAGGQPYDPNKVWVSVTPRQHLLGAGLSLRATYTVNDHLTLKSISATRGFKNSVNNTNDGGTSYIFNDSHTRVDNRDYQQEFQALYSSDRLNLVTGVFLFNETYDANRIVWSGGKTVNVGTTQYIISRTDITSYAAYAQAEYQLFPKLFVTGGVRYSRDEAKYTNFGYSAATNFTSAGPKDLPSVREPNATGVYSIAAQKSWGGFTPRIEAHYQWTPDIMTYASFSKGYKAGGFDIRAATAATAQQPFDPEFVNAYEGGFKATLFDRRLRTNLAVFYNDFEDLQITAYDAVNFIYRRVNAAAAHTTGAELEVTALPIENLELSASAAYLEARYDAFTTQLPTNAAGVTTLVNRRLYWAPKWSTGLTAAYTVPVGFGSVRASTNINYRSKAFTDIYNTPQLVSPSQYFVNASLVWKHPGKKLSVGVYADNLFNNRKPQGGVYGPTSGPSVLVATGGQFVYSSNPPRFVRASVKYEF